MTVATMSMKRLLLPCLATVLLAASCHAFATPTRFVTTARPASSVVVPRFSAPASTDSTDEKKRRSSKASESIFLKLFGFASPSPASMVLVVPALAFGINGNVPITKLVFSLAFPMYLGFLNRFRFDLNKPAQNKPIGSLLKRGGGDWYDTYHNLSGLFSALIPTVYCFAAPLNLAKPGIAYAYLSLMQYVWETLCRSPNVHVMLRLLIPLSFNSMRLLSVVDWMRVAIPAYDISKSASLGTHVAHITGLTLGVSNAVLLAYNLFGLFLPRILPQYLDQNEYPTAKVKWIGQVIPIIE